MDEELKRPLIVGNWKMYGNVSDSIKLMTILKNRIVDLANEVEVVVAPPFTSLYSVSVLTQETPFRLAAQNCFYEEEGAYTGEISPLFLKEMGCHYVLVGHSERRKFFGDTDAVVAKKLRAVLQAEMIPIFCVGEELAQRKNQETFEVIERQLRRGLSEVYTHDFEELVIAYEPVWAIGTGEVATPEQAQEVLAFIRNFLTKYYDSPTAAKIRLLYGGSVKPENSAALMRQSEVDGLLVGGASLQADAFSKIVQFQE